VINAALPLTITDAVTDGGIGDFHRLRTTLSSSADGARLVQIEVAADEAEVEWLHPFSWDAEVRGVRTRARTLGGAGELCLHAGPYGTADAVAHAQSQPMRFPEDGGVRYLAGDEPRPEDDHQDSAAWVLVRMNDKCLVLAWEYSGSMITHLVLRDSRLHISTRLPLDTFHPAEGSPLVSSPGPVGWLTVVPGDLDAGAAALRALLMADFISAPDLSGMPGAAEFPCLAANSWGVLEDTSTERILGMMDGTAGIGAEVFVVDKGWERRVGDWHPNDRFPSGMRWLSDQARDRGMGFGIWCGFGNADPQSPVALEHPDWLTEWRGELPRLSFGNLGLCLGHDPARDWILDELRRMVVEFRLTWLIHDFESISRCDRSGHTHDPGAGEHAAEAAWHRILRTLRAEFPQLVLENCWNGSRPLDLAMLRSHHTTIAEDHCRSHWNSLAKVGLGRYLPLDWQSAYMGAEDLPARARIAPYVIGGPWILMDEPQTWSEHTRETLTTAADAYRRWRGPLRTATVCRPQLDREHYDAVQATTADGTILLAASLPPGGDHVRIRPTGAQGSFLLTDEWTGETRVVSVEDGLMLPVDPAGDGILISLSRQ
jgi:hypothetical protein